MSRKIRILVVEDEPAIRAGLEDVFVFHGYEVDSVADGAEGYRRARQGRHDLLLLDVMLPSMNGFEICERIRAEDREQPIIMLTARTTDDDVIQGLKLGADDYVAKPFSVQQLVLRVEAVLRRSRVALEQARHLALGDHIRIDVENLSGEHQGDEAAEPVSFTRREMDLLQYLAANADRAISRDELLHKVWGYAKNLDLETRTVDIHVAKLRRKIEPDPASPRFLVTVRGAGYRLHAD